MNQIAISPRDYTGSQLGLIKRTVAKDTNEDEFSMFVEVCRRVGLDPFRRQIYCNVYSKDNPNKRQVVFITGIDGFRAIAHRCHDYRPDDEEPAFTYDETKKGPLNPLGLVKAVVRAYKSDPQGAWHAVVGVAYWDEFAPIENEWDWVEDPQTGKSKRKPTDRQKLTGKWPLMPQLMLAKCAEAQALRKGWPEDTSGLYVPEEMARADVMEQSAAEALQQHETELRERLIGAANKIAVLWKAGDPIEFVQDGQFMDRAIQMINGSQSPSELDWWAGTNRHSLQEFWARHKADALELKKALEARLKALEAA